MITNGLLWSIFKFYLFCLFFSARFDVATRQHSNMKTKAKLHFKLLKYFIINYDAHSFIVMSFYTAVSTLRM